MNAFNWGTKYGTGKIIKEIQANDNSISLNVIKNLTINIENASENKSKRSISNGPSHITYFRIIEELKQCK